MARNRYPGYCYCCGKYVPPGYGHFELQRGKPGSKWRIKCVKCASGRIVKDTQVIAKLAMLVHNLESKQGRIRIEYES